MRAPRLVQCLVLTLVVSTECWAWAFVRETTGFTSQEPVAWSSGCVLIAVVDPPPGTIAAQDLLSATSAAATTWTQASNGCGGGFNLKVEKAGVTRLGAAVDGVNAVVLRTENYCNSTSGMPSCDPLSTAVTWLSYVTDPLAPDFGRLFEADIEINGEAYRWGLAANAQEGIWDLESALTHELGHIIGLDHNCYQSGFGLPRPVDDRGSPVPDCGTAPASVASSVMYAVSSYGVERRTLSADDVGGICTIYPSSSAPTCQGSLEPSGGCTVGGNKPFSDSWPVEAVLVSLLWIARATRRNSARASAARARCTSGPPLTQKARA
jgi:hypothetical protein